MNLRVLSVGLVLGLGLSACQTLDQQPKLSSIGSKDVAQGGPAVAAQRAAMAVPAPEPARYAYQRGSLWNTGPKGLLGDKRARALGDILTVKIEIDESAEFKNTSTRTRAGSQQAGIDSFFGIGSLLPGFFDDLNPNLEVESNSSASGSGSIKRNEKLAMRIAATVVQVLPNGHLVIQGDQEVRVNNELRDLQVVGIVRPEDISRYNEISYDRIAGARISYGGRGQISAVQEPRWGHHVLEKVIPH